jgi:hypothetical protein
VLRWPPFAKGSLSVLGTGFAALLAYEGAYRALAGAATIPINRPIRLEFERGGPASCVINSLSNSIPSSCLAGCHSDNAMSAHFAAFGRRTNTINRLFSSPVAGPDG